MFKHAALLWTVFLTVVIGVTLLVYFLPPTYTAESLVLIEYSKSPTARYDPLHLPQDLNQVIYSEVEIVMSRTVAEEVVDKLDLVNRPAPDTFARRMKDRVQTWLDDLGLLVKLDRREKFIRSVQRSLEVDQTPQSSVLSIQYTNESAPLAAEITRAVTDVYLKRHRKIFEDNSETFFKQRLDSTQQELSGLRKTLERESDRTRMEELRLEIRALESTYLLERERWDRAQADSVADPSLVNVRVVDYPVEPVRPDYSRLALILLSIPAGLALAVGLALLREYFDHTVYTPDDLADRPDIPVLGSVRHVGRSRLRAYTGAKS